MKLIRVFAFMALLVVGMAAAPKTLPANGAPAGYGHTMILAPGAIVTLSAHPVDGAVDLFDPNSHYCQVQHHGRQYQKDITRDARCKGGTVRWVMNHGG